MSLAQRLSEHRHRIYPVILILIVFVVWKYRTGGSEPTLVNLRGTTFGTVAYNIQYRDTEERNFKSQIDSLLVKFNEALSTYVANSEINEFNREGLIKFELPFFYPVLAASEEVYAASGGAFDPTVGPLIDAWGFGPEAPIYPDSTTVDSLLQFVNFDSIYFDSVSVCRLHPGLELSFSAIAKGQGVDVVADFLLAQGLKDVFVEIGGEVAAYGQYTNTLPWVVGIEDPNAEVDNRRSLIRVALENKGMATSGNYRNYYVRNNHKYAHTINPTTGYPVEHNLLSATVLAENCMMADAYATAFMVMGLAKSKELLHEHPELNAILIFDAGADTLSTYITPGIAEAVLE